MSTPHINPPDGSVYKLNRSRYFRIVWFFGWVAAQAIWLYLIVQPILGRRIVKRGEEQRFRRWSRQFRELAVHLGGVMIKLGQFVSSRIDVLPPEIVEELAGLQDEVPPRPFSDMEKTLHNAIGKDWRNYFSAVDQKTVAAASLGQAYRATLAENGERVVIKVQRPHIAQVVYTDLTALDMVARFAMRFRFISRRADVPLLLDEFARVLWEELDYTKESANADRFAELFANDMGVYIPAVHHELSSECVIVLEDVTAIKLNDYAAIEAAGLDRRIVAQRLLDTYLTMVFVHRFFHADPHPGNIFIYPLPDTAGQLPDGGQRQRKSEHRPFYIVFIDFGMTGELTPEMTAGLREMLLALLTRDAERLTRSYLQLQLLLPGADVTRLNEANRMMFDKMYGMSIAEMANVDMAFMRDFTREFGDILFELPFQVPQDFVYFGRAIGMLSGMCTGLDPEFSPWEQIMPFAQSLLMSDDGGGQPSRWRDLISRNLLQSLLTPETVGFAAEAGRDMVMQAVNLPAKADKALTLLERGEITIQINPTPELEQQLNTINRSSRQMVTALIFGSLTLASTFLYLGGETQIAIGGAALAGITLLMLIIRGR